MFDFLCMSMNRQGFLGEEDFGQKMHTISWDKICINKELWRPWIPKAKEYKPSLSCKIDLEDIV